MPSFNVLLLCLQGSDIETLGSEAAVEYGSELLEHPPVEEAELQGEQASASNGRNPPIIIFLSELNNSICILFLINIYNIFSSVC